MIVNTFYYVVVVVVVVVCVCVCVSNLYFVCNIFVNKKIKYNFRQHDIKMFVFFFCYLFFRVFTQFVFIKVP